MFYPPVGASRSRTAFSVWRSTRQINKARDPFQLASNLRGFAEDKLTGNRERLLAAPEGIEQQAAKRASLMNHVLCLPQRGSASKALKL